jgi:hypothetical protein
MAILSTNRKREIEARVQEIFKRYLRLAGNVNAGEVNPRELLPVRTDLIMERILQVRISREEEIFTDDGSKAAGVAGGQEVLISERQPSGTKRFTEGHEIGHLVLHPGEVSHRIRLSTNPKPIKEHEADWFATNLLMPEALVREEFIDRFRGLLSQKSIEEEIAFALTAGRLQPSEIRRMDRYKFARLIARATWFEGNAFLSLVERFGVSENAMALRLIELGLIC